jgi:hypothetical protein
MCHSTMRVLVVGVDLASADLLARGKQFPVSWHPVPERIASVIAMPGRPTSAVYQCPDQYPHWLDDSGESQL